MDLNIYRHSVRKIPVRGLSIPLLGPVVQKLRDNARVSFILIRWIVIYPVDIAIQRLNNRDLEVTLVFCKSPPTHPLSGTELKSECVYCRYHWD